MMHISERNMVWGALQEYDRDPVRSQHVRQQLAEKAEKAELERRYLAEAEIEENLRRRPPMSAITAVLAKIMPSDMFRVLGSQFNQQRARQPLQTFVLR